MSLATSGLDELLASSSATEEFKLAVREFHAGKATALISHSPGGPAVKVMRVIMKLLETEPSMEIEKVHVDGRSGCSDFRGDLLVNGDVCFRFVWDCRWRAEQKGMKDAFGLPDQIRAAQQFGYQCFQEFCRL